MRLENQVVIVTGGANGIGSVYCKYLAQEGARVVIADIDIDHAEVLAKELNEDAGEDRAMALKVDVTSESDTRDMALAVVQAFNKIDVLINNAGTYPHVNFEDITYEAWRRVFTVNIDSVFLCTRAALPQMKKQESGKIINVTTDLIWIGLPGMVHYVSAKAGIIGFTRSLAREVGDFGITVNAIAPGAIVPPLEYLNQTSVERVEAIVSHQCVKWYQQAEDLVGPMLFLASSDSDFMSGQILTVDGGLTNH
jgi:NAD(P)-dependent dehydrogenase (short-subunit alcohol dehydrogenase family)